MTSATVTYYTYKSEVPLLPGQTVRFKKGKGYYAYPTIVVPPDPWVNIVSDQFDTPGLPAHWYVYDFANSRADGGYYIPSHATVPGDGSLHLLNKWEADGPAGPRWYQGTVALASWLYPNLAAVDQRITFRMRVVQTGPAAGSHRNMPLRWPDSNNWPIDGEEDFYESDGSLSNVWTYFHYGATNEFAWYEHAPIDLTQWHTFRFQRLNFVVTEWIDDMVTPVYTYQGNATTLPATSKHPVFQQECIDAGCPVESTDTEDIQFDWIVIDNAA